MPRVNVNRRSSVIALLALSAGCLFAQSQNPDPGGWTTAKWGMTRAGLQTPFPQAADNTNDQGLPFFGLKDYEISQRLFFVEFNFDRSTSGLASVLIMPQRRYFPGMAPIPPGGLEIMLDNAQSLFLDGLMGKYGKPDQRETDDDGTRHWRWLFPETTIEVERSGNLLMLSYRKRRKSGPF